MKNKTTFHNRFFFLGGGGNKRIFHVGRENKTLLFPDTSRGRVGK